MISERWRFMRGSFERGVGAIPDAVIVTTAQGVVLDWNAGAEAVFGYPCGEAVGQPLDRLIVVADQLAEQQRLVAETLRDGAATFEAMRCRKDGALVYVDVTGKVLGDEAGSALLFVEKDVTSLRVRRDGKVLAVRFCDLLESTPDGIVMVGLSGHILIANSQAERLFGYAAGELRGRLVEALLPERLRTAHIAHRAGYFSQPRRRAMGVGLELFGLRQDGSEFPVEISLAPLNSEEIPVVMSAIRDITERKRFEQALQEKNAELEEANRAKNHFLAGMSHELRTPLNAVIGFTGTLLMKLPGPINDEQMHQLGLVQSSARHLLALINDLLDVAKIEAGKVELHPETFDAGALLDEVAASLRVPAQAKGLDFALTVPAAPLSIHTDRRALRQILLNLAGNAVKFTEHGSVRLSLRHVPETDAVVFTVEDSGPGISGADQAQLFQPFARGADARKIDVEGTGLGLHLSRKLAEMLGGQLGLDSEYGRGSTFTLSLKGQ
jgi:PAS domain S-box-containing protein